MAEFLEERFHLIKIIQILGFFANYLKDQEKIQEVLLADKAFYLLIIFFINNFKKAFSRRGRN